MEWIKKINYLDTSAKKSAKAHLVHLKKIHKMDKSKMTKLQKDDLETKARYHAKVIDETIRKNKKLSESAKLKIYQDVYWK